MTTVYFKGVWEKSSERGWGVGWAGGGGHSSFALNSFLYFFIYFPISGLKVPGDYAAVVK